MFPRILFCFLVVFDVYERENKSFSNGVFFATPMMKRRLKWFTFLNMTNII
jgi:hypothetical protein